MRNDVEAKEGRETKMKESTMDQSAIEQQVRGNWNQFSGRLKEVWGALTDNDLKQVEGRADRLVGMLQEKTGETRQEISKKLNDVVEKIREIPKK